MHIIIDATWIGNRFGTNDINGGYRVIDNFIKQLYRYPEHHFYLTHTTFQKDLTTNLKGYLDSIGRPSNITIQARIFNLLSSSLGKKGYAWLSNKVPVNALISFLPFKVRQRTKIYYSPLDGIPYSIRKNNELIKFFTALDLIPLVRPDLSNIFYTYTKNLYEKLTRDTYILAISENTKKDLLKIRPDLDPQKIKVTYLGADKSIFYHVGSATEKKTILQRFHLEGQKYYLTVNNLAPYKNSRFVINSFLEWVKADEINDLKCVIIGRALDEKYANELKSDETYRSRIVFLDNLQDNDLAALYSGALAFLYLSKYEGFGLPVLESFQCGTPVICSNVSSLPEVAGSAAISVDPTDKVAFIEAMKLIYFNPEVRVKYSRLGTEQAKLFSWEKYADQVIEAFQSAYAL